jgi:hypothetical protein
MINKKKLLLRAYVLDRILSQNMAIISSGNIITRDGRADKSIAIHSFLLSRFMTPF